MSSHDQPPGLIPYAGTQNYPGQSFDSVDRTLAARLARVLGVSMLLLGLLLLVVSCAGYGYLPGARGHLLFLEMGSILALYVVPGVAMSSVSPSLHSRGVLPPVLMLIIGLWVAFTLLVSTAVNVWSLFQPRGPDGPLLNIIANAALGVGIGKLLYHDCRILFARGQYGSSDYTIKSAGDWLWEGLLDSPEARRRTMLLLGGMRLVGGALAVSVGAYCLGRSLPRSHDAALDPITEKGTGGSFSAGIPLKPIPLYSGDVFGPHGLPAIERGLVLAVINSENEFNDFECVGIDTALRHVGADMFRGSDRPLTRESVLASINSKYTRPPHTFTEISFKSGYRLENPRNVIFMIEFPGSKTVDFSGDLWQDGIGQWSFRSLNEVVDDIDRQGGACMTQPQADGLVQFLVSFNHKSRLEVGAFTLKGAVGPTHWHPNHLLQTRFNGADVYISPTGSVSSQSPEKVAAAQVAEQRARIKRLNDEANARLLHVNAFAAIALVLGGGIGAWVGIRLVGRMITVPLVPVEFRARQFVAATLVIWMATSAVCLSLCSREIAFYNAINSVSGWTLIFCWLGWTAAGGVWLPLNIAEAAKRGGVVSPQAT